MQGSIKSSVKTSEVAALVEKELASKKPKEKNERKVGAPISFGKDSDRDNVYTWEELYYAPNRKQYLEHLEAIPNKLRLPQEKDNLKVLKKGAITMHKPNLTDKGKSIPIKVVNEWHNALGPNSECPCGSKKKWKKCHQKIINPHLPMSHYMKKGQS